MTRVNRLARALPIVLVGAAVLMVALPASAAFPGTNGRIAFQSTSGDETRVAVVSPTGAGFRFLTPAPGDAGSPAWSANGRMIAFVRPGTGIFVMEFDGSSLLQVTTGPADDLPAWSPDGTHLAFVRPDAGSGKTDVWAVPVAGGSATNLTANPTFDDTEPAWSPDGAKIAFASDRGGNWDIFTMDANGANAVNLSNNPAADRQPNWSPDGLHIAFTSDRSGASAIWSMAALDGSDLQMLTDGLQADSRPAYSPEGTAIAFTRALGSGSTIFVMGANGGDPTDVVLPEAVDSKADWQPIQPDAHPPIADAGASRSVECTSPEGAPVLLDGSASSDADSTPGTNDDIVLYEWWQDYGQPTETFLGTGETLDLTLSLGSHEITLQVSDHTGETARDLVTIDVVDTTPPTISVTLDPSVLWPPNHKMVKIHANVSAHDVCGPVTVVLSSVSSSEAPLGHGSGRTNPDISGASIGTADYDFYVRAERSGNGPGRVYTAAYTATDASSNPASAAGTVTVPHDRGQGGGSGNGDGSGSGGGSGNGGGGTSNNHGNNSGPRGKNRKH